MFFTQDLPWLVERLLLAWFRSSLERNENGPEGLGSWSPRESQLPIGRITGHLPRPSRGPRHQAWTRAPACGRQAAARGSEGGARRGSNGNAEELSVKSQKPPTCKTGVMGHAPGSPGTTWRYSWLVDMFDLCVDRNEQCRCPLRFPTEVATELLAQLSRAQPGFITRRNGLS